MKLGRTTLYPDDSGHDQVPAQKKDKEETIMANKVWYLAEDKSDSSYTDFTVVDTNTQAKKRTVSKRTCKTSKNNKKNKRAGNMVLFDR